MQNTIGLKELMKKHKRSESFLRTILCRPELNKYRMSTKSHLIFNNTDDFNKDLNYIFWLRGIK